MLLPFQGKIRVNTGFKLSFTSPPSEELAKSLPRLLERSLVELV